MKRSLFVAAALAVAFPLPTLASALDYESLETAFAKAQTGPDIGLFGAHQVQAFPGSCFEAHAKTTKKGAFLFAYGEKGAVTQMAVHSLDDKAVESIGEQKGMASKVTKALQLLEQELVPTKKAYGWSSGTPTAEKAGAPVVYALYPGAGRSKELGHWTQVTVKSATVQFTDASKAVFLVQQAYKNSASGTTYCLFFAKPAFALNQ